MDTLAASTARGGALLYRSMFRVMFRVAEHTALPNVATPLLPREDGCRPSACMRSRSSSSQAHFNTDTPQKSLTRLGQWSEQLHRTPAGSTPNVAQSLAHSCLGHVLKIDGICTFSTHAGWPLGVLPTVHCKVPGNERMCARRSRNGLEWRWLCMICAPLLGTSCCCPLYGISLTTQATWIVGTVEAY